MSYRKLIVALILGAFTCLQLNAQKIVAAEYFIGNDPGVGNGTPVTFAQGDNVNFSFSVPVTGLSEGFHNLFLRVEDENGNWSLYEGRNFYVQPHEASTDYTVDGGEYFIDTEPGVGNGTALASFIAGAYASDDETISLAGLSPGFHNLHIRVKSSLGQWSTIESRNFYIQKPVVDTAIPIATAEYYVDNEPGIGSGNSFPVEVTDQGATGELNFDVSKFSEGFHYLFIRTKDLAGNWSLSEGRMFYARGNDTVGGLKMVSAEYFVNDDPGIGKGTQISFGGEKDSVSLQETIGIDTLLPGVNTLTFRVKNRLGFYSKDETREFIICVPAVADFSADTVCAGGQTAFVNLSYNQNVDTSYQWDFNGSGSFAASNDSAFVHNYNGAGTYTVTLVAGKYDVCSDTLTKDVLVMEIPAIPVIEQVGNDTLMADQAGLMYDWYLNDVMLDVHDQAIQVNTDGDYKVVVSNGVCGSASEAYTYTRTGISNDLNGNQFSLYPNPGNGLFTLQVSGEHAKKLNIEVFDVTGKMVYQNQSLNATGNISVDLQNLQNGIYFMNIRTSKRQSVIRVIIHK
ncbi:MAG TPA: T9SS type A sorting domain-containing protein [Bacteroidales bacterium]|nr:T9SS type A sorting domain-containing protein [Bacteroidales bacterium]